MNMDAYLSVHDGRVEIRLYGDLDEGSVPLLRSLLDQALAHPIERVVFRLDGLEAISAAGIRCLISAQQAMPTRIETILLGVRPVPAEKLRLAGLTHLDDLQPIV